jgi:HNH endonuclease
MIRWRDSPLRVVLPGSFLALHGGRPPDTIAIPMDESTFAQDLHHFAGSPVRRCPRCGTEFITRHGNQRYCSSACAIGAQKRGSGVATGPAHKAAQRRTLVSGAAAEPMLCACGCGAQVKPGRRFLLGHRTHRPMADRFWEKVDKTTDCWLWTGAFDRDGYPRFDPGPAVGKPGNAARTAYVLVVGPIPPGWFVMQTCKVRACVRPDHLVLRPSGRQNGERELTNEPAHAPSR